MSDIRFVLSIAVSEDATKVVLLTKNRGPAHVIGKTTFPGGRMEQDDPSEVHAARRELAEETGIDVPLARFELLRNSEAPAGRLAICFCVADISAARTMEDEVVRVSDIDATLALAKGQDSSSYTSDFVGMLELALPKINAIRAARRGVIRPRV